MSVGSHPTVGRIRRAIGPLRRRDFRLLWMGQTISAVGSSFQSVALVWLILERTGSGLAVASALLALSIPGSLASLVGGAVIDRFDARSVMLCSDGVRAVASAFIAVLAGSGLAPVWVLYMIVAASGTAGGFFSPTIGALVPRIVPDEELPAANSLAGVIGYAGTTLGILPAAAVIAVSGPPAAFAVNSLSFALSFAAIAAMSPLSRATTREPVLRGALASLALLWRVRWLGALLGMDAVAAVASLGPIAVGLPILARDDFHSGAFGYGILRWSFGIGSILGALAPAGYIPAHRRGRTVCLVQLIEGPALAAVAVAPLPVAAFALGISSFLNGYLAITMMPILQRGIAPAMLGRVMGLLMLASTGFVPLSYLLTGVLAAQVGAPPLFALAGLVVSLAAVLAYAVPQVRMLD